MQARKANTLGAIHSTKIPTGPTGKSGPPQKVDPFFRNFSGWTEPIHWVLDRNFRKVWLNGSRPFLPTGISFFFVCEETLWGEGGYSFYCLCCSLHFTISLFLTLKPRAFIYSGTPPYGHLVNTVTFFYYGHFFLAALQKRPFLYFVLVKKPSLIRSPRYYGQFFWPLAVTVITGFHCIYFFKIDSYQWICINFINSSIQ